MDTYEKKYKEALELARVAAFNGHQSLMEGIFPELRESEDEKIRKELIEHVKDQQSSFISAPDCRDKYEEEENNKYNSWIAWLEKQGTPAKLSEEEQNRFAKGVLRSCAMSFIDYLDAHKYEGKMCVSNGECEDIENAFQNAMWDRLHRYYCKYTEKQDKQKPESYDEAEKEKADFVGNGFIECQADFLDFREGNTYWLEYIGNDRYNVRSDNLLGKTYHISPCHLYTIFKKQTWLEKQGEQKPADKLEPIGFEKELTDIIFTYTNSDELSTERVIYLGHDIYKKVLEAARKEIEQKPAWSEEDEEQVSIISNIVKAHCGKLIDCRSNLSWLQSLKQRIGG